MTPRLRSLLILLAGGAVGGLLALIANLPHYLNSRR